MSASHRQAGCINPGAKLSFLRQSASAKSGSSPFPARLTNGSGDGLLMRIGTTRLPIVIINWELFFASVTGCNRFGLRGIKSITDIVVNQLIFVMIIPVVAITLI
jgi:hypothetical protein